MQIVHILKTCYQSEAKHVFESVKVKLFSEDALTSLLILQSALTSLVTAINIQKVFLFRYQVNGIHDKSVSAVKTRIQHVGQYVMSPSASIAASSERKDATDKVRRARVARF